MERYRASQPRYVRACPARGRDGLDWVIGRDVPRIREYVARCGLRQRVDRVRCIREFPRGWARTRTLLRSISGASLQQPHKFRKILRAYVGNGPELETFSGPTHQVISLARFRNLNGVRGIPVRPHEHVDEMFPALVDQRC